MEFCREHGMWFSVLLNGLRVLVIMLMVANDEFDQIPTTQWRIRVVYIMEWAVSYHWNRHW